ncbi:molybdate ABC transporter permease subunit [Neisseriaceae bacterium B1]
MDNLLPALLLSLKVATCATAINLLLGTLTGYALAKHRIIARDFWDTLLTLPMVLPPTVLGYYLLVLFGKQGALGQWLQNSFGINLIFTWQGAVIATTVVTFPLIVKPARSSFESVNPELEHAARMLGLTEIAIFLRVTFPLAWRGILAGVLLAFARALGEFGATLMIAGSIPNETQTLSIAIYEAVQAGDDTLANQLVIVISVVCVVILWLAQILSKPRYQKQQ